MFIKILDYKIFRGSKAQCVQLINNSEKVNVISGNPEILYNGLKDERLFNIYSDSRSLIIPDGVGTVVSSKIVGNSVSEKIAGIEIMDELIKSSVIKGEGIYFLGAKQEILDKCLENLKNKYPDIIISGAHNGYFDIDNCEQLIKEIIDGNPQMIFVAMGCPRQELFISKYMEILPCKVFMGVGGSFDVISGKISRAPKWMLNLGLEWLHRVVKEPFRIKRLFVIPKFLFKVITSKRNVQYEKNI